MTTYELYRDKYLCLPGGTVQVIEVKPAPTGCLCLARDLNDGMIESYETASDGMVWGIWPECPVHHGRYKSPVWHPVSGDLRETTAVNQTAVAQEA